MSDEQLPSTEQSPHGEEKTVNSVLSKGFSATTIDDVAYLLSEVENGRIGKGNLPLVARTCAVVIRREKQAGQDVADFEERLPIHALKDWWEMRLERQVTKISSLLSSGSLKDVYLDMISFIEGLQQADEDSFNTDKIKEDFKKAVSGPLMRAYLAARKSPTLDDVVDLINLYSLVYEHKDLFEYVGATELGELEAIRDDLEAKQK